MLGRAVAWGSAAQCVLFAQSGDVEMLCRWQRWAELGTSRTAPAVQDDRTDLEWFSVIPERSRRKTESAEPVSVLSRSYIKLAFFDLNTTLVVLLFKPPGKAGLKAGRVVGPLFE